MTNPRKWSDEPIEWNESFRRYAHKLPELEEISRWDLSEQVRFELCRFRRTLQFYEMVAKDPIMSPSTIWFRALDEGPSFTDALKDIFDYSLRKKFAVKYSVPPEKKRYIFPLSDYNSVFPVRGLPFWVEETDDFPWSQIPVSGDAEILRPEIRRIIQSTPFFENVADDEIFRTISSSTSLWKGKRCPFWETSANPETRRYAPHIRGERCIVPVCPGGWRDTIILERDSSNTCRWAERAIRCVLATLPECVFHPNPRVYNERLRLAGRDNPYKYHIWRDIRKCGLTFNRDIIQIIADEMFVATKDERWKNVNFDDFLVHDPYDNTFKRPCRGYGLGMANSLATLGMIATFRVALKNAGLTRDEVSRIRAIFGNDDAIVSSNDSALLRRIRKSWFRLEKGVGNILNVKKSGIFSMACFFEEYNDPLFQGKESLLAVVLARASLMPDVRMAKEIVSSVSRRAVLQPDLLQEVVDSFPPEFFPEEVTVDFEVGGWLKLKKGLVRTTYLDAVRIANQYGARTVMNILQFIHGTRPESFNIRDKEDHVVEFRGQEVHVQEGNPYIPLLSDDSIRRLGKLMTSRQRNPVVFYDKLWKRHRHRYSKVKILYPGWYAIPPELVEEYSSELTVEDIHWELRPDQPSSLEFEMRNSHLNDLEAFMPDWIPDRVVPPDEWTVKHRYAVCAKDAEPSMCYASPTGIAAGYQHFITYGKCPKRIRTASKPANLWPVIRMIKPIMPERAPFFDWGVHGEIRWQRPKVGVDRLQDIASTEDDDETVYEGISEVESYIGSSSQPDLSSSDETDVPLLEPAIGGNPTRLQSSSGDSSESWEPIVPIEAPSEDSEVMDPLIPAAEVPDIHRKVRRPGQTHDDGFCLICLAMGNLTLKERRHFAELFPGVHPSWRPEQFRPSIEEDSTSGMESTFDFIF